VKVVILAGGYGTRFGKLTDFLPKPMIPVGPYPVLWHIMRTYAHHGFNDFIICTGYKSEMIKDFFHNLEIYANDYTIDFGVEGGPRRTIHSAGSFRPRVTVAYTGQETATGSRVKRIARYLGDDPEFMVTYGDGVTDLNIADLVKFHRYHGKIATLTAVFPPAKFGDLKLSGHRVNAFAEKTHGSGTYVNGGYFVFKRQILDYIKDDAACILEKEPMERLSVEGNLMAYQHDGFWQCMDTTRDLEFLQKAWAGRQAPWKVWEDDYQD
jgi:glucose-1-phosphate cytidylyltransferase